MKKTHLSPAVLAWGLAAAGAAVLFVSGGCRIIQRVVSFPERMRERHEKRDPLTAEKVPEVETAPAKP